MPAKKKSRKSSRGADRGGRRVMVAYENRRQSAKVVAASESGTRPGMLEEAGRSIEKEKVVAVAGQMNVEQIEFIVRKTLMSAGLAGTEVKAKSESCGCGGGGGGGGGGGTKEGVAREAPAREAPENDYSPDVHFLLAIIRDVRQPKDGVQVAFVPDVSEKLLESGRTWGEVKKTFERANAAGAIELRPAAFRLSSAERALCVPGPNGEKMAWVSIRDAAQERPALSPSGASESAASDLPAPTVCRPFTRVVRDRHLYEMCLERAKKIGEISDHRQIYELVQSDLASRTQESFFIVKINFRGDLIDYLEVAQGQQHKVAVDIEDIMYAVINGVYQNDKCDGFAVIHNHPSGKASPSPADKALTDQIRDAASIACPSTAFMDHIVCGTGEYYSFTDKKLYKVKS